MNELWGILFLAKLAFLGYLIYQRYDRKREHDYTYERPKPQVTQPRLLKNISNPQLKEYLQSRELKKHLTNDFRYENPVTIEREGGYVSFYLELDGTKSKFGNTHFFWDRHERRSYSIVQPFVEGGQTARRPSGVAFEQKSMLIYPFFDSINFYPELNIFACIRNMDHAPNVTYSMFAPREIYYFDVKGRHLISEIANTNRFMPSISFDLEKQEIISLKPLAEGITFRRGVTPYIFIGEQDYHYGLYDNKGNQILAPEYRKMRIEPPNEYTILQQNNAVLRFQLSTKKTEILPYHKIVDSREFDIRVNYTKHRDSWGVIDINGNELVPATYDFVEYCNIPNRYRIFTGDFTFDYGNEYEELLEPVFNCYAGIEIHGKLNDGKWGICDDKGNTVIPSIYDWVEDVLGNYFIVNLGGQALFTKDESREHFSPYIKGGLWGIADKDGNILDQPTHENLVELVSKYESGERAFLYTYGNDIFEAKWTGPIEASWY